jgi:photosystem II stability/assembly factor-like uncharacterized protein
MCTLGLLLTACKPAVNYEPAPSRLPPTSKETTHPIITEDGINPSETIPATPKPSSTATKTVIPLASTATMTPEFPADYPVLNIKTMVWADTKTGWLVQWNDPWLLRSEDGGRLWHDISPLDYASGDFEALDDQNAWISVYSLDPIQGQDMIYRTTDGGATWSQFQAPFTGGAIHFLDTNQGWASAAPYGCAAGTCPLMFYSTQDGGITWVQVEPENPLNMGGESFYPSTLELPANQAIWFSSLRTMWLYGERNSSTQNESDIEIYVSRSEGTEWQKLELPIPDDIHAAPAYIDHPVFFNDTDGYLSAWYPGNPTGERLFFFSNDAGESWSARPERVETDFYSAQVDFVSTETIFTRCGEALCVTQDGAQTAWQSVISNLSFNAESYPSLSNFDFVDPLNGYAIVFLSDDASAIYRTQDGGLNWNIIETRIE